MWRVFLIITIFLGVYYFFIQEKTPSSIIEYSESDFDFEYPKAREHFINCINKAENNIKSAIRRKAIAKEDIPVYAKKFKEACYCLVGSPEFERLIQKDANGFATKEDVHSLNQVIARCQKKLLKPSKR